MSFQDPSAQSIQSSPSVPDPEPSEHPRSSILIVDDSATVRAAFAKQLRERFDCLVARDVAGALEELRARPFDLVITDVLMPGISGVELLRKIMDGYPQTAVIVVSSVDRPQRVLDAVRLGAFDYLIKPCEGAVLLVTVERALERRRLLINAERYKADLETRNVELAARKAELERLQASVKAQRDPPNKSVSR